jgi:DNA topoisomerase-1
VLALQALRRCPDFDSAAAAKRNVVAAIESVAQSLGNTKAVCRKSYIHPALIDAYLEGSLANALRERAARGKSLRPDEARVLQILKQRLASDARRP